MNTIEKLCRYKDVTNLVYQHVHRLLTKEITTELKMRANITYKLTDGGRVYSYRFLYDDVWDDDDDDDDGNGNGNVPCFNWRTLPAWQGKIFHISHKTVTLFETNACTVWCY